MSHLSPPRLYLGFPIDCLVKLDREVGELGLDVLAFLNEFVVPLCVVLLKSREIDKQTDNGLPLFLIALGED